MKKVRFIFLTVSIYCCFLIASVLGTSCTDNNNVESNYELTAYTSVMEVTSSDNRFLYLQPKICTNDDFTAEMYGFLFNGESVLNVKKQNYKFKQIAGRVWVTNVSVGESYDGEVTIYARRRILGKTLNVEYRKDIYGNEMICEIGEGYGEVDWLKCFSYTYFALI